ncbi:MAG: hypothetical protein QOE45_513 [Frankiaceae bacterium]|nr:hypothetical protein [Frankiaceae bacterium]
MIALLLALASPAITVSDADGLRPGGDTVVVSGSGFDVTKGVYVAFCVDRGPGVRPTPCGGGADTTGASGGSQWVSSDPPPYGRGLAVPYGPGGTFTVRLAVSAKIGTYDCRDVRCAVVTRADHTRTEDRTQDARVPVTFAAPATNGPMPLAAGVGAASVGALGVALLGRRRRT